MSRTTKASDDDGDVNGDDNPDNEQVQDMTTTHRDEDTLAIDDEKTAVVEKSEPWVKTADADGDSDWEAADDSATDADGPDCDAAELPSKSPWRQANWSRVVTYGLLPAIALLLAVGAGYLKWTDSTNRASQTARTESVQIARDSTVALLSYTPADVRKQLVDARDLLTGQFRDAYTGLTDSVVIPGALQQQITAVATVPAASSVSATADHAVVLVFVNQSTTVGTGTPTDLASTVRVVLDKVNGRWLISQFDPV